MSQWVAVVRARSHVAVAQDGQILRVVDAPLFDSHGAGVIEVRTLFETVAPGVQIHRDLLIAVRGPAESIDEAASQLGTTAAALVPVLSFAMNAYIEPPRPFVVYEVGEGASESEFRQDFAQEYIVDSGIPRQARRLRPPAVGHLITALGQNGEQERIRRAIDQYWLALSHWVPARRALALSHLFMGAEALKVAALRRYLLDRGVTADELADEWNVQRRDGAYRRGDLEAAARLHLIFQGDETTHRTVSDASDAYEHGYGNLGDIDKAAALARDKTADYLRRSIIACSGVPPEIEAELVSAPLAEPLEVWGLTRTLRADIINLTGEPAGDAGFPYPHFSWIPTVEAQAQPDGEPNFRITDRYTASIGDGAAFRNRSIEVRGSPQTAEAMHITRAEVSGSDGAPAE